MPDLIDFLLYCFYNSNFKAEALGMKKSTATLCNMGIKLVEQIREAAAREFRGQPSLHAAGPHRGPGTICQGYCLSRKPDRRGLVPDR